MSPGTSTPRPPPARRLATQVARRAGSRSGTARGCTAANRGPVRDGRAMIRTWLKDRVHVVVQEASPSCAEACVAKEARERRSGCEQELAEGALPLRGAWAAATCSNGQHSSSSTRSRPASARAASCSAPPPATPPGRRCPPEVAVQPHERGPLGHKRPPADRHDSSMGTPAFRERLQVVTSGPRQARRAGPGGADSGGPPHPAPGPRRGVLRAQRRCAPDRRRYAPTAAGHRPASDLL
jgi:hypothetical protein